MPIMAIINTAPDASGHCDAASPVRDLVRRYQRIDGFGLLAVTRRSWT